MIKFIVAFLLLASIVYSSDFTKSNHLREFTVAKITNINFQDVDKEVIKFIEEYHLNQSIPKSEDDCISVYVCINGDLYISLWLPELIHNEDYTKFYNDFKPKTIFIYRGTNYPVILGPLIHHLHFQENMFLDACETPIELNLECSLEEDSPNKFLPNVIGTNIIEEILEYTKEHRQNIQYLNNAYEDIKFTF